jgi:hypothetical protein
MKSITQELEEIIQKESKDGQIYLKDFVTHFGDRSLVFIIAILALPIALPFTPPGINTPFAVICIILILNWMIDKKDFKLPKWLESKKVPFKPDGKFFAAMKKMLSWIEYIIKPRGAQILESKVLKFVLGLGLLSSAIVMLIPLPVINSVSSLLVLLISISIVSKDGVLAFISAIGGILLLATSVGIVSYGLYIGQSFFK